MSMEAPEILCARRTDTGSPEARALHRAPSTALALLAHLFAGSQQMLAVRVATEANLWADRLSRGDGASVLLAAAEHGWESVPLRPQEADWGSPQNNACLFETARGFKPNIPSFGVHRPTVLELFTEVLRPLVFER